MARLIRDHPWEATPLGPLEAWSERLKLMVEQVLGSSHVASLACGPERLLIYNDAAARFYGAHHPAALGQPLDETFPEGWGAVAAYYGRALSGETVRVSKQALDTRGEGRATDVFDAVLTPVREADGHIAYVHMDGFEIGERVRTETALRKSEARFRALVTASTTMIYRMSPDWQLMHELSGRDFLADTVEPATNWAEGYLLPEDRTAIFAAIDEAIRTRTFFELEHRVRTIDGGVGWVHSRAVPMLDEAGAIVEWFGTANDVTGRREGEARQDFLLRLSDALRPMTDPAVVQETAARLLGEHLAADRAYYVSLDEERQVATVAQEYRRGKGLSIVGRHPFAALGFTSELMRAGQRVVVEDTETAMAQDDLPACRALSLRAFLNTPLVKGGRLVCAMCVAGAEPRRWSAAEAQLVAEVAERTWGAVERARVEAALRESEERLRQFGEASSDVLWIRNAETFQWEYLTPAFQTIYGQDRETALRGDNMAGWLDLVVPDDREQVAGELARVRDGEWVTFEYRIRRPSDGALRWLRNTDFPIRDEAGRVIRIGGIGQDITGERETAERLGVLVGELQHRTKNLMGVVNSVGEQTLRASRGLGDFAPAFRSRMGALVRVNGLLSRLREGNRVSFDELIRAEIDAVGDAARAEGRITLSGPGGVLLRSSTVQIFALALHELATNAVKHGALRPDAENTRARLTVSWRLGWEGDQPWLAVDWRESGVTVVEDGERPQDGGAGRQLIEQAIPYQLKARTSFVVEADGVHCTIALPVSKRGRLVEKADA